MGDYQLIITVFNQQKVINLVSILIHKGGLPTSGKD